MSDFTLGATPDYSEVVVDGLAFACLSEKQVAELVVSRCAQGAGGWVITPNVDMLYLKRHDPEFRALLDEATLLVADGAPIVAASRIAGEALPGRVCGSDLLVSVSEVAASRGVSVYFLGGNPGTAEKAANILAERFVGFSLAGTHCPPLGFENDPCQMELIERLLQESKPQIVFVALGTPKQEILIARLRSTLPGTWWLGIGAGFSMLSGEVVRAPRLIGDLGLEWLWRFAQEPTRLFERYIMHDTPVAAGMLARAVVNRIQSRAH